MQLVLEVGSKITYTLPSSANPVHPDKEWEGRILLVSDATHKALVQLLTPGYTEFVEWVEPCQIVRIIDNVRQGSIVKNSP